MTFPGLAPGEKILEYFTYNIELAIFKLITIDSFSMGLDAVFWHQPKIFMKNPYVEKPQIGGMLILKGRLQINESLTLRAQLGYKSNGYTTMQQAVESSPILSLGFEYHV